MKKQLCLLVCALLCFISFCLSRNAIVNSSFKKSQAYQVENKEVVDSGKYYRIYKGNITQMNYEIYNSNGKVISCETTDRPLAIDMLNADIVDIAIGMGTGLTIHRYYSVERNLFSEDFSYVLANLNELVAYVDVPEEQSFENRKIVVRNIFDKDLFYKEYPLDFSNVDTPIIYATFLENGTSLQLVYLSGEEQIQISKTLNLCT